MRKTLKRFDERLQENEFCFDTADLAVAMLGMRRAKPSLETHIPKVGIRNKKS
jgi:hypothetical protein